MTDLLKDLAAFAEAVERTAFQMPAPNPWTPVFVSMAQQAAMLIRTHAAEIEADKMDAESWRALLRSVGAEQLASASQKFGDAQNLVRDAGMWNALCADCDRLDSTSDQTPINIVTDACFLGSGALERHYDAAMRNSEQAEDRHD